MKLPRHAAILEVIRTHHVPSQEALRERLAERGIEVAQATLSRDIRTLGLVKAPDGQGGSAYVIPAGGADTAPTLTRLLPSNLYQEISVALLNPSATQVSAPATIGQAIQANQQIGSLLSLDQSLLIVWPQIVALIALTVVRRYREQYE